MATAAITSRATVGSSLSAGLVAGAAGAVAAVLLSLPLRSPAAVFLNTTTVGAGTILLGLLAGLARQVLSPGVHGARIFTVIWLVGAMAVAGAALAGESVLSGLFTYVLPLAVVAFAVTGVLTLVLSPQVVVRRWMVPLAPVAVVGALVLSVVLAGRGVQQSGALALPAAPAPAAAVVQPTAAHGVLPAAGAAAASPPPAARAPGRYAGVTFVIGQGSKATFTVSETLARMTVPNNAVVSTSAIAGELHLDGRPSTIKLDLWRLSSDQPSRDRFIRTTMFPNDQLATFVVTDTRSVPDGTPLSSGLNAPITGVLTLRGRSMPLTFTLEGRDDGDAIYVLGRTKLTWKEIGVEPPASTAVVQVSDEVNVEVLLAARPG